MGLRSVFCQRRNGGFKMSTSPLFGNDPPKRGEMPRGNAAPFPAFRVAPSRGRKGAGRGRCAGPGGRNVRAPGLRAARGRIRTDGRGGARPLGPRTGVERVSVMPIWGADAGRSAARRRRRTAPGGGRAESATDRPRTGRRPTERSRPNRAPGRERGGASRTEGRCRSRGAQGTPESASSLPRPAPGAQPLSALRRGRTGQGTGHRTPAGPIPRSAVPCHTPGHQDRSFRMC